MRACEGRGGERSGAIALVAGLSTLLLLLLMSPIPSFATETERTRFKGEALVALSSSDTECTYQRAALYAYISNEGVATVSYISTMDNYCDGTYSYTYGTGPATEFKVTALNTGRVVATIPVTTDSSSGGSPNSTLYLDQTWTGNGPIFRSTDSQTVDIPGEYHFSYRFKGSARSATVTGTFEFNEGSIQKVSTAELIVRH